MTLIEAIRLAAVPLIAGLFACLVVGCSDRTSAPAAKSTPSSSPAPSATPSPSGAPVVPPSTAADVTKKGTSTGMIGGESGTVSSSGKPGTGTTEGSGTGAAQSSGSQTVDKK